MKMESSKQEPVIVRVLLPHPLHPPRLMPRMSDSAITAESSESSACLLSEDAKVQICQRIADEFGCARSTIRRVSQVVVVSKEEVVELGVGVAHRRAKTVVNNKNQATTQIKLLSSCKGLENCCRDEFGQDCPPRFVVKQPRDKWDSETDYESCVRALLTEAQTLAKLDSHSQSLHMTKLRAISFSPPCLIIDRLVQTLGHRIENRWHHQLTNLLSKRHVLFFASAKAKATAKAHRREQLRALWEERLRAAHDLTLAIKHLHSVLNIAHCNLNLHNVGWDSRGTLKLTGFGHAVVVLEDDTDSDNNSDNNSDNPLDHELDSACDLFKQDILTLATIFWHIFTLQPWRTENQQSAISHPCFQYEDCELPLLLESMMMLNTKPTQPTTKPQHVLHILKRELAAAKSPDDLLYTDLMDFHLLAIEDTISL